MCNAADDGFSDGVSSDMSFPIAEKKEKEVVLVGGGGFIDRTISNRVQGMILAAGAELKTINSFPRRAGLNTARAIAMKKIKLCLFPGCGNLTAHNGGYCCADHCREHKDIIKKKRFLRRL